MQGTRILIVGAGLAGLALARALRQAGLASEVIEREVTWEMSGPACTCRPTAYAPCGRWAWRAP